MESLDGFIWFLVAPHITNVTTASRLSRTNRSLNSICNDRCISLCFSRKFLTTLKTDLEHESLAALIPSEPIPDWILEAGCLIPPTDAIKDMLLGHVSVALKAAYETHKLHVEYYTHPLKEILGWCRYVFHSTFDHLTDPLVFNYDGEGDDETAKIRIIHLRLPSKAANEAYSKYAGGLLWLACANSESYTPVISLLIPRSTSCGVIRSDFQTCEKGEDVVYDPCQAELCELFNGGVMMAPGTKFTRGLFQTSLRDYQHRRILEDLLGQFQGRVQPGPIDVKTLFYALFNVSEPHGFDTAVLRDWVPLWFPSINVLYEDRLAMHAMLSDGDENFISLLSKHIERIHRKHAFQAFGPVLYETHFPWFMDDDPMETDGSDSEISESSVMEEDEEEEEEKEEDDLMEPGEWVEADWDAQNHVNLGITDAAYYSYRKADNTESIFSEEDWNDILESPYMFSKSTVTVLFQAITATSAGNLWFKSNETSRSFFVSGLMDIWWREWDPLDSDLIENSTLLCSAADTDTMSKLNKRQVLKDLLHSFEGVAEVDKDKDPLALAFFFLLALATAHISKRKYGQRVYKQELEVLLGYRELWTANPYNLNVNAPLPQLATLEDRLSIIRLTNYNLDDRLNLLSNIKIKSHNTE
ncbi:hypothetical protein BDR26DRAFT_848973 [Obelidium mucronatum]|nr:hypothetical protein BDR26DRAFT_848973 [Obelidium mucronatum]